MSVQYYYYLVLGFNIMFQLPKMGSSTIFSLMDPTCAMMKMFVHERKKELLAPNHLVKHLQQKCFFFFLYLHIPDKNHTQPLEDSLSTSGLLLQLNPT